ncbi:MAG: uroporphyrinogen decarboxylase family protein, partial [Candidatus Acidiferrales bacterium]
MAANSTPRQIVKGLLQGTPPARPLFLPIVFSLGARVENIPLRTYLTNPTKISNSLRQIRGPLRSDGLACYFDPFLEVEALGAELRWESDEKPPSIHWPQSSPKGEIPAGLRSPEEAAKSGRVPVALEVIRRLNSLLRDESILMAGVTGPFTLAARLA